MNKIKRRTQIKKPTGQILLLTMFILTGILVITLGAADLVLAGIKMNRLTGYSNLAFFASEAGMERALWEARKNNYVLPANNTNNLFAGSLLNGSSYGVNYATSTPIIIFQSVGNYNGVKRSVESTYQAQ